MTIAEALSRADDLRKNTLSENIKVAMLSELDGRIYFDILHPEVREAEFVGYDESTPSDTKLLVPYPYDALYVAYLDQEICKVTNEVAKYNNARIVFNEKYEAFARWYTRTHSISTPNIKFPKRRY